MLTIRNEWWYSARRKRREEEVATRNIFEGWAASLTWGKKRGGGGLIQVNFSPDCKGDLKGKAREGRGQGWRKEKRA